MLANDMPAVKVLALACKYSIDKRLASYFNRSALEGSQALAKISWFMPSLRKALLLLISYSLPNP